MQILFRNKTIFRNTYILYAILLFNLQFTSFASESHPIPVGLRNIGNTCFLNGLMQLLVSGSDFTTALTKEHMPIYEESNKERKKVRRLKNHMFDFLAELKRSQHSKNRSHTSKKLIRKLKRIIKDYKKIHYLKLGRFPEDIPGSQQDPAEFLQKILDFINYNENNGFELADVLQWKNEPKPRITNIKKESILNLSLRSMDGTSYGSVQKAIEELLKKEEVDGSKENDFVKGEKQFRILNAPKILFVQLKRYDFDFQTLKTVRVHSNISVGNINLPIANVDPENDQELSSEVDIASYSPVSIEVHSGGKSLNSGHYYTYTQENNSWVCHNDKIPAHISKYADNDIKKNAYLIKYKLNSVKKKNDHGNKNLSQFDILAPNLLL